MERVSLRVSTRVGGPVRVAPPSLNQTSLFTKNTKNTSRTFKPNLDTNHRRPPLPQPVTTTADWWSTMGMGQSSYRSRLTNLATSTARHGLRPKINFK
ncbi:L-ascorbate oxidase [Corchorus olitorius]|uniref:L-ascorbate oxidase n=1 Tax=Corchorus olitorius TaxID=93759 RepID=A0A1R3JXH1_9ROSI|nr:L-ascorbate oxidase [Corchorus olitorius]